ncbi:MAG: pitrilysin family protein [Nanoarchaeota archaeon]
MKFLRRKLKNGMTIVMEKRESNVVSVGISNPYGGGYDDYKVKGIAHFIEHLLFTGTKTRTHEDISREIEKRGGILNAGTYNELTIYQFKLPSEHLFIGLDILTDMLKNSIFEKGKFEKEKRVIFEEIKMNHDVPTRHIWKLIETNLFEGPFGDSNLGTFETLSAMKRDFVKEYFEEMYNPGNFIVSIVGNANFNEVCDYFEENFKPGNKRIAEPKVIRINKESVEEREGIDQAHFIFAVHCPSPRSREFLALQILDAYLGRGMSSRLFLEIREKRGLAYAVQSAIDSERNGPYYAIYVGTTKDKVEEVKEVILDEFKKIKLEMDEKDLEEAKEMLIGLRDVESEESNNTMIELVFEELLGNAESYYEFEEKVRGIKLEEVKELAEKLIKNYSTASVVPK